MTINLATIAFKTAMFGTSTRVDLDADVIKVRAFSTADLPSVAPGQSFMTSVPKYALSTDQTLTNVSILTTVAGGFDARSTVAFDSADNAVFPAIVADAGKAIDGLCVFKFVSTDANSTPLMFLTGFAGVVPANAPITVAWANTNNRIFSNTG